MKEINSREEFETVIRGERPSVIKFEADWCPDCKYLDTFIDDVVSEFRNKDWYQIDCDQFGDLTQKYNVMGIPSLLIFENGEKTAHLHSANAKTPDQVKAFLETV